MSSALPIVRGSNTAAIYGGAATDAGAGGNATEAMSDTSIQPDFPLDRRQEYLEWLWSFYKCANYESYRYDFDGRESHGHVEHNAIATAGYIPPGFYDAGQSSLPVSYRKPYAPYYLIREIVDRFTNLLFSDTRIPALVVEGDDDTSDYYNAIAEEGSLWVQMGKLRTFGGAMTSAAMGFRLEAGKPVFEVHDPRWCEPTFEKLGSDVLKRFEKRYIYQDVLRNADDEPIRDSDGRKILSWFWYRRVVDKDTDVVWDRVPAMDREEPIWDHYESQSVTHGLGVVPIRWVKNIPVEDGTDGEPDAAGVYELILAFDTLMAAAQRATLANCDPQLAIYTDEDIDEIIRGVGSAIRLGKEGQAQLLEMMGTGPKTAMELAEKIREIAFEIAACVPDTQGTVGGGSKKTATEVISLHSRMLEKAGKLRTCYGKLVADLFEIVDMAVRKSTKPTIDRSGPTAKIVIGVMKLPPRVVKNPDGTAQQIPRKLGAGGKIKLNWPRYFEPTLDDTLKAAQAVSQAMTVGAIDAECAAKFLANYFPIDDIPAMLDRIKKSKQVQQEAMAKQALSSFGRGVKVA